MTKQRATATLPADTLRFRLDGELIELDLLLAQPLTVGLALGDGFLELQIFLFE